MIPTRIHAVIDWLAVPAVELMGHSRVFSGRVRRLLKGSARAHAVYAAATDYELGAGILPMRAHLGADAAIGVGLIAAGLSLHREPTLVRIMLAGMGMTELLLVSLTDRRRR
ncbi:hypothetical protein SAMN05216548_11111 [Faunimonas pinastri]|uniref:Uncharacterized protein n=1 Tax=Faunimonas pinastri TaxID=1855383 RepID=A0A1H9L856_9HYPH|nr:hypothetical protein [Faunimonas pinastri]SER07662.1 hypothetical protein SAMN05216548_11111 [Faunimonas pinastri]